MAAGVRLRTGVYVDIDALAGLEPRQHVLLEVGADPEVQRHYRQHLLTGRHIGPHGHRTIGDVAVEAGGYRGVAEIEPRLPDAGLGRGDTGARAGDRSLRRFDLRPGALYPLLGSALLGDGTAGGGDGLIDRAARNRPRIDRAQILVALEVLLRTNGSGRRARHIGVRLRQAGASHRDTGA